MSFSSDEFVIKKNNDKSCSIKNLQEAICQKRVDLMRIVSDLQAQLVELQKGLQEDFFAFASGDKKTILSSKDRVLLEKEIVALDNCYNAIEKALLMIHCL